MTENIQKYPLGGVKV